MVPALCAGQHQLMLLCCASWHIRDIHPRTAPLNAHPLPLPMLLLLPPLLAPCPLATLPACLPRMHACMCMGTPSCYEHICCACPQAAAALCLGLLDLETPPLSTQPQLSCPCSVSNSVSRCLVSVKV